MQASTDRILTTHVGSLPRSKAVTDTVFAQERGETVTNAAQIIREAVDDSVARQVAAGVDVVSDGEMSKISYATYIKDRITGFDGDSDRRPALGRVCHRGLTLPFPPRGNRAGLRGFFT